MGGFSQKILSFVLIPLYTSCLSTESYGTVDLLINVVQLFYPILNLSIHEAVLSFALDKKNDSNMVCSIAARYNIVSVGIFLCGILVLRRFHIIHMNDSYIVFVCTLYIVNLWNLYLSIIAKVYNRIALLATAGFCNTLIYLVLNILFLKYWCWGIDGYMTAYVAGTLVSVVILVIGLHGWKLFGKLYDKVLSAQMRAFSSPLILNQAAWWINNVSDRYMLTWMRGTQMNGIYSMAYKIPNILAICQNFVLQAWTISAIEEHEDKEAAAYYSKVFSCYCFILCVIASLLLFMNNAIATILFKNDFYEAKLYAPILLLAVIYSSASYFLGAILMAEKDSLKIMKSTMIGAVVNVALNTVLIPLFSIYGAAIATLLSNLIILLYRLTFICKKNYLKVNFFKQVLVNILLIIQIILCNQNRYFLHPFILAIIIACNQSLLYEVCVKGKEFLWKKIKAEK